MESTQINIRVDIIDLADWKSKSKKAGLTLSAWIRKQCNPEIVTRAEIAQEQMKARTNETYYHTAESNRMTCLCVSCYDYRKRNDIPFGGFK